MSFLIAYLHGASQTVPWAMWATAIYRTRKGKPMRTTLDSGAWIDHVPIQDIKGKHIRAMQRAGKSRLSRDVVDDDGEVDVGAVVESMDLGEMQEARHDALWALIIEAWSYDFPVPQLDRASGTVTGAEVLDELSGDDYREIDLLLEPFGKKLAARPRPKEAITSGSNGSSRASAARGSRRA